MSNAMYVILGLYIVLKIFEEIRKIVEAIKK